MLAVAVTVDVLMFCFCADMWRRMGTHEAIQGGAVLALSLSFCLLLRDVTDLIAASRGACNLP